MSEHPVLISASFFALYSVANDFSPVDTSVDLFITTPELSANDLEPARVLLLFISSTTPLILSSVIGLVFCLIAVLAIIFIIVRTLLYGDPTSGWPSLVCIIVFVSGIQLFSVGIIGQYLSKTYLEVKNRPIYIVKETEKNQEREEKWK